MNRKKTPKHRSNTSICLPVLMATYTNKCPIHLQNCTKHSKSNELMQFNLNSGTNLIDRDSINTGILLKESFILSK